MLLLYKHETNPGLIIIVDYVDEKFLIARLWKGGDGEYKFLIHKNRGNLFVEKHHVIEDQVKDWAIDLLNSDRKWTIMGV